MLYFAQGNAIITREEFVDKNLQELPKFFGNLKAGRKPAPVSFSTGDLTVDNVHRGLSEKTSGPVAPWGPIGPGKPLTIRIREIYTGNHPDTVFGGKRDILVSSAVKAISTFDAQPRAINFLESAIGPHSRLFRPTATKQGTPIVFYSPALIDRSLTLTAEVVFDKWNSEIFNQISSAFQSAAGVPIFLPYSMYILAASAIVKLVGSAGEALFDGKPSFSVTEGLDFELPGSKQLVAGYLLMTEVDVDNTDPSFRTAYHVNDLGQVVNSAGKKYAGPIPYIVISLDGTEDEKLAAWAPTAASAAVLGRFLGMNNGQSQPLSVLVDAIKLYNDFTFRQKVDKLDRQIESERVPDNKAKLQQQRDAAFKNILEDLLRPK